MKIPKYIFRRGRKYKFIKKYNNFALYENVITGVKTCYDFHELGLIEDVSEVKKGMIDHPERVSFF